MSDPAPRPSSSLIPAQRAPQFPLRRRRAGLAWAILACGLVLAALLVTAQKPLLPAPVVASPTAFPRPLSPLSAATAEAMGPQRSPTPSLDGTGPPAASRGGLGGGPVAAGGGGRCWAAVPVPAGPPLIAGPQLVVGGGTLWLFGAGASADQTVPWLARWDGTRWVAAPTPSPPLNADLTGLLAPAVDDLWLAGAQRDATASTALLEHWDGRQWAAVAAPASTAFNSQPLALAARSATDLWIGGATADSAGGAPLLLHWDGHTWHAPSLPDTGAGTAILALAVGGLRDAWAASARNADQASALHWDGATWQLQPLPAAMGRPAALAVDPADHVWLAGRTADHQPVLLRGSAGSWQPLPRPLGGSSFLIALAAAGPADLWTLAETEGQDRPTQVLHWTAAGWTDAPQPAVPAHSRLTSLVLGPDGALWAAGSYREDISGQTVSLVLRYGSGPCLTPTPTRAVAVPPTRPFRLPGPLPTAVAASNGVAGTPHYLFAFRVAAAHSSLVAYDYERQTEITLQEFAGGGVEVSHITSDGRVVVWAQRQPAVPAGIAGYDLLTHTAFRVAQAVATQTRFGGLAVIGATIYYTILPDAAAPTRAGLYAHMRAGGPDTVISAGGANPVAGDGVLLWQEAVPVAGPTAVPSVVSPPPANPDAGSAMVLPGVEDCTLHLHSLDVADPARVIAHFTRLAAEDGCFAGYAVSGDHVVWTANAPGAGNVALYTRSTGRVQPLAGGFFPAGAPLIAGGLVVWPGAAADEAGQPDLLGYQIDTGRLLRLVAHAPAPIQPQFILNGRTVVYTLGSAWSTPATAGLYAVDVPNP